MRPARSLRRPGSGLAGPSPTGRPGGSACTTRTPARSARAGSGNRSSSPSLAQVVDNADGIVLDHDVDTGNPPDAPRLKPAVARVIKRTRQKPRTVAADRGYGEASVDDDLDDLGITNPVIPRKGKTSKARQAHEKRRAFRQVVKWRTGCEGRISHLKRNYGLDRTKLDTLEGARTWTGHGVFAHNLTKIANLAA